jgi:hypothetical protein
MRNAHAANTIIAQSSTAATPVPHNGVKTEVLQDGDGNWLFNWTPIFDGVELEKQRGGVFDSYDNAEAARQTFIANEKKKVRLGFQID